MQNNPKCDSPERDGSVPHSKNSTLVEAEKLSTDELHFIKDAKNTNFTLLEEMFGSKVLLLYQCIITKIQSINF